MASHRRDELSPFAPYKPPVSLEQSSHSLYSLSLIIFQLEVGQEPVFSLHAGHKFTRESMQETTMHNPLCYYCFD